MSAASKGSAREHKVRRMLEADGWVIARSAGSKSCVDLWALRRVLRGEEPSSGVKLGEVLTEVMAVQVKANVGSPWMNFRGVERAELGLLAAKAGATPFLVHWPPHGECRWYPESDWPEAKVAA
jgi:hypothetical protein